MIVEATFNCADGHEPVWFNSYHCPVCEAKDEAAEHALLFDAMFMEEVKVTDMTGKKS